MTPALALESLHEEVGFVTRRSIEQGREHLDYFEIEHLLKMTNDVIMKIKKSTENSL